MSLEDAFSYVQLSEMFKTQKKKKIAYIYVLVFICIVYFIFFKQNDLFFFPLEIEWHNNITILYCDIFFNNN